MIQANDRVKFIKFDRRMNYYLERLLMREGKVRLIQNGKALVDFGIMESWWISLSRLELQIPCYSIPHFFGDGNKCLNCGEPKK